MVLLAHVVVAVVPGLPNESKNSQAKKSRCGMTVCCNSLTLESYNKIIKLNIKINIYKEFIIKNINSYFLI